MKIGDGRGVVHPPHMGCQNPDDCPGNGWSLQGGLGKWSDERGEYAKARAFE